MSRYIEMCKECIHYQMCHSTDIDAPCAAYKNKANVVEVVRCKDCRFWDNGRCEATVNGLVREFTEETDYCSYGKRKKENEP